MSDTQEKRREYPARMFFRATLTCPSCSKRYRDAVEICPHCGFDAYRVVRNFPFEAPVLERVLDNAGVIGEASQPKLERALDRLKMSFPQVEMCVCTLELADDVNLAEFGFWMMNACRLRQGQVEKDRAWTMLLLLDVRRGMISLTPGYALEAFIEDSGWEDALRKVSNALLAGDFESALLNFIKNAERLLGQARQYVLKKLKSA